MTDNLDRVQIALDEAEALAEQVRRSVEKPERVDIENHLDVAAMELAAAKLLKWPSCKISTASGGYNFDSLGMEPTTRVFVPLGSTKPRFGTEPPWAERMREFVQALEGDRCFAGKDDDVPTSFGIPWDEVAEPAWPLEVQPGDDGPPKVIPRTLFNCSPPYISADQQKRIQKLEDEAILAEVMVAAQRRTIERLEAEIAALKGVVAPLAEASPEEAVHRAMRFT